MILSYLRKSEHLVWSVLEDNGDLGQVGGTLPQQASLSTAGWSKERTLSSKLLSPVLHLVCWRRIRSHTQISAITTTLSADVDLKWSALVISPVGIKGH